eukprot:3341766-Alexandrium_andersonii.AAC.1
MQVQPLCWDALCPTPQGTVAHHVLPSWPCARGQWPRGAFPGLQLRDHSRPATQFLQHPRLRLGIPTPQGNVRAS